MKSISRKSFFQLGFGVISCAVASSTLSPQASAEASNIVLDEPSLVQFFDSFFESPSSYTALDFTQHDVTSQFYSSHLSDYRNGNFDALSTAFYNELSVMISSTSSTISPLDASSPPDIGGAITRSASSTFSHAISFTVNDLKDGVKDVIVISSITLTGTYTTLSTGKIISAENPVGSPSFSVYNADRVESYHSSFYHYHNIDSDYSVTFGAVYSLDLSYYDSLTGFVTAHETFGPYDDSFNVTT